MSKMQNKSSPDVMSLLAAIVDSSDDAIISKDLDGIITSWNKSAERIFGYTADEAIGKPVTILIPQDRQQEEPQILARLRRGERVDHFETVRRRKEGGLLDVSLTISPVKDAQGRIVGVSKVARDITQRKHAEEAVKDSEAHFRLLADSMPQIIWTARPDGHVDYYNEQWYRFTGFERGKFGDLSWEPIMHPDDAETCRRLWYEAVRSGEPYMIEYRFRDRHENRWRWFLGRALPARDSAGRIIKWFGTATDIDEQKKVEDDLRRANSDLEQFAYSASHDLQEPLRTIKIYARLLAEDHAAELGDEAAEFLHYLQNAASRMEMLVRDLLAYTRTAKLITSTAETDANDALESTLADLNAAIKETGATVTSDTLPAIRMDRTHLKQLFQNLISNAVKYRSPDRNPVVKISAERNNEFWIFTVRDNGIGIEPRYKEQIFGLFKRLHSGDKYSGTGIGLAICQRIAERYGGRIWVESEPGEGSAFRFAIPV